MDFLRSLSVWTGQWFFSAAAVTFTAIAAAAAIFPRTDLDRQRGSIL
jgi:hypothetical protein